jgi:hypothetical protein
MSHMSHYRENVFIHYVIIDIVRCGQAFAVQRADGYVGRCGGRRVLDGRGWSSLPLQVRQRNPNFGHGLYVERVAEERQWQVTVHSLHCQALSNELFFCVQICPRPWSKRFKLLSKPCSSPAKTSCNRARRRSKLRETIRKRTRSG